jgi:hypothetical protein
VPWAGLSVLISGCVLLLAQGGVLAILLSQTALLVGITLYRVWRDPH